jgi:hypothetical protein
VVDRIRRWVISVSCGWRRARKRWTKSWGVDRGGWRQTTGRPGGAPGSLYSSSCPLTTMWGRRSACACARVAVLNNSIGVRCCRAGQRKNRLRALTVDQWRRRGPVQCSISCWLPGCWLLPPVGGRHSPPHHKVWSRCVSCSCRVLGAFSSFCLSCSELYVMHTYSIIINNFIYNSK